MFSDFYLAFHFLDQHEMFQGHFESCLGISVVKVNPETKAIEDDEEKNTEVNVWLECGKYSAHHSWHDYSLDCGGRTFEDAIIELANLVWETYGDTYEWTEDDPDCFMVCRVPCE